MFVLSKQLTLGFTLYPAVLLALLYWFIPSPGLVYAGPPQDERPFQLPFAQPPGLDSWLMAQPYGNTSGAYRQRFTTYGASGGIHFGLDLSAPCGTEIVALADGVVFAIDGPFGSPPHNLMIDHPQVGYASMYGHLLKAPNLVPGQEVKQGQVIALVGDMGETCYSRPHLHLEIRDLNHVRKYNPQLLIEANWDNLALIGNAGRDYARDLEEPRKWQTLYHQPEVQTGGPIVNDFAYSWPFNWNQATPIALTPASPAFSASPASLVHPAPLAKLPFGRQVTAGDCCTQPYWSPDSTQVRFIDLPGPDAALGIWGVNITQAEAGPELVTRQLGIYSPDGTLVAYPDRGKGVTVVQRLADGQTWEINTQKRSPSFTPDSRSLIWTVFDENAPGDSREETIWLAGIDSTEPRVLLRAQRTSTLAWLANERLLMSRRIPGGSDVELFALSLADGSQVGGLQKAPRMRGLALSPDRRYLVYYVSFEPAVEKNGLWLLDLESPLWEPQKLPFFGAYRWRDDHRLVYVPFDPRATEHNFYQYDVRTGQTSALFPAGTGLTIANNDWRVSPDGRKIALVAGNGTSLNGIWVLEPGQE